MKNKRGLSQIVVIGLIIAISLVLLGIVWVVVNQLILDESSKIRTDQITTGIEIEYARIDLENETATVRIARDVGSGDVIGIKIIVEDNRNAISFDQDTGPFLELEKRTFDLDLSGTDIVPSKIEKIIAVPILSSGTAETVYGMEAEIEGENILNIGFEDVEEFVNESENSGCTSDSECGEPFWREETEYCKEDNTAVMQYKTVPTCTEDGFCRNDTFADVKTYCPGETFCQNEECIEESNTCTNETIEQDCGIDGWVGMERCSAIDESVVQDYEEYDCISETCESTTTERVKEECNGTEICNEGECFVPLECTSNEDCDLGEICVEGNCTAEEVINNGTIDSIWPFNLGEYFDSPNLERAGIDYTGNKIIFPGSNETRCLTVIDHVLPENPDWYAYVRLNDDSTGIRPGDYYEIWETEYACTLI